MSSQEESSQLQSSRKKFLLAASLLNYVDDPNALTRSSKEISQRSSAIRSLCTLYTVRPREKCLMPKLNPRIRINWVMQTIFVFVFGVRKIMPISLILEVCLYLSGNDLHVWRKFRFGCFGFKVSKSLPFLGKFEKAHTNTHIHKNTRTHTHTHTES